MHNTSIRFIAILCAALAISPGSLLAQSGFSPAIPGRAPQLYKESGKDVEARFKWFSGPRMDSGENTLARIRLDAWEQHRNTTVHSPRILMKGGKVETSTWTNIGPRNRGGRITGIAVHPENPDIVYFTAAAGGVWKTTNGGDSFVAIADDLPTMSMGAIAIDRTNPDIVWVGTGEANGNADSYPGIGIVKSTDAGATWNLTGYKSSTRVAALRVHPSIGDIAIAATLDGIQRTEDGGATWKKTRTGAIYDLAVHPSQHNIWYAGVKGVGMVRSTDTGRTWESISTAWDSLGVPVTNIRRIALDVSVSNPDILYAVLVQNSGSSLMAIMKTTDGGTTWEMLPKPSNDFFSGFGWYMIDLAVDPSNPNRVLIGGLQIYLSIDGGQSWKTRNPSHVDQHALEFAPSNPSIFYAGHDGGFDKSTDGGDFYNGKNSNLPITQYYDFDVYRLDPDIVLGGTQDNGSHLSSSSSPDWKRVTGGDGTYCVIDYTDRKYMYTKMQNASSRWRSVDSGRTWGKIMTGITGTGPWVTPTVIDPKDPTVLYTVTTEKLYKTTNRGEQWFELADLMTTANSVRVMTVCPVNTNYIAVGYSGNFGIGLSTDGGATWTKSKAGLPSNDVTDILFHPTDIGTMYVTVSGNRSTSVYKSVDTGATWSSISGNLPAIPKNSIVMHPNDEMTLYVATDLGVYVTTDGGATWERLGTGMPNVPVIDLDFHAASGKLRAATHGRSIYELLVSTPVLLETFTVSAKGASVLLQWRTTVETNNAGFAIERRSGANDEWKEIGYVNGNGSGGGTFSYTFSDDDIPADAGMLVYRLKQIDFDGSYTYSSEVYIYTGKADAMRFQMLQNYPNPFNPVTTIAYEIPESGEVRVTVTDSYGKEIACIQQLRQHAGWHNIAFDASALPGGVYFYHLTYGGKRITKKMAVLK